MINRQSSVSNNPYLPETLEIPVAHPQLLPLDTCPALCFEASGMDVRTACRLTITSAPWEYAAMPGARLRILRPEDWEVETLTINGRVVPMDQPCAIFPGGIAILAVRPTKHTNPRSNVFKAYLESTGPVGSTGSTNWSTWLTSVGGIGSTGPTGPCPIRATGSTGAQRSPEFLACLLLLRRLDELIAEGNGDGTEADAVRNQMEEPWYAMTEGEQHLLDLVSADVSTLWKVPRPTA